MSVLINGQGKLYLTPNGNAIEPPAGIRGVHVAGTDLTPDENNIVNVKLNPSGLGYTEYGIYLKDAPNNIITQRSYNAPITPHNMDYAVKSAMCDGIGPAWTTAEQKAARGRLGEDQFELIEEITLEEDASFSRDADPNGNSYDLKDMLVYIEIPAVATSTIYFAINKPFAYANDIAYFNGGEINKLYGYIRIGIEDGYLKGGSVTALANANTPGTYSGICPALAMKPITSIQGISTGGSALPAGTVLKIYGIWR